MKLRYKLKSVMTICYTYHVPVKRVARAKGQFVPQIQIFEGACHSTNLLSFSHRAVFSNSTEFQTCFKSFD